MTSDSSDPLSAYRARVRSGAIGADPAQELAAEKLNLLHRRLAHYRPPERSDERWFSRVAFGRRPSPAEPPQGLYLFGGVGRGKSMMMDHAFMLEVHGRIHEWRREGRRSQTRIGGDPIPPVAGALADEAWLLCFDEFQIKDPADALILDRLFSALFESGVVVVATSNVAPGELYAGGLNRDRFVPFLDLLQRRLDVLELDAGIDYRRGCISGMRVYFTPADGDAAAALDAAFASLAGGADGAPDEIVLSGRTVPVPWAADGVARFAFADLCERPLGAADYLAIAELYHTVVLADVPTMGPEKRNEAARFVTLVDALYEHKVNFVCSAAAEPGALYPAGDGSFEFARTASRLYEMQSDAYMAAPHLT